MTPEEFDDARFGQGYWAAALVALVALVLIPVALMVWAGWTEDQALRLVGGVLVGWAILAGGIYATWARARRRRRRGGRR